MPRYVAKEDVEKGLVDPTRPLQEQLQYKQKIDKQALEKQKHQQPKNVHQRPKKQRPARKERPKFNWNKNDITLETKVPEKPKKLIEKPNVQKHREGLEKLKAEREILKQQKQALYQEQRAILRDLNESKKSGKEAISQYSGAMRDKFTLQNQLRKEIRFLDDQKKKINYQLQGLSYQLQELRKPSGSDGYSFEYLNNLIESKEHELMTANIGKREESKLTNQINQLKRALVKARPYVEIESQALRLQDQINLLYRQVKPIKHELHIKITQANSIRSQLDSLKEQRKTTQGQSKVLKTGEDIKAEYDLKFKALEERKDKLEDRIDDYMDNFVRENDDYDDQQDLLKHIKWVEDQIAWQKKRKEQDQLKKKEQEERQKRRQKEKEQYQKRQEERKKQDQQRKARDEARKKKIEEEREKYINRNPNHQFIDLCEGLISYCESLRPNALYKPEDPRNKQAGQLSFGKEWQKQIKSGAQVIQSKKSKQDEQAPKKQPKPKKKEQKAQDEDFSHGIEIVNQFQSVKLLPPINASQVESAIKLIKDKIAFYSNPTEEQKAAFKERAARQFDERNGPRERREGRQFKQKNQERGFKQKNQERGFKQKNQERGFKQKNEEKGQQHQHKQKKVYRKEKKQLNEQDFPGIA